MKKEKAILKFQEDINFINEDDEEINVCPKCHHSSTVQKSFIRAVAIFSSEKSELFYVGNIKMFDCTCGYRGPIQDVADIINELKNNYPPYQTIYILREKALECDDEDDIEDSVFDMYHEDIEYFNTIRAVEECEICHHDTPPSVSLKGKIMGILPHDSLCLYEGEIMMQICPLCGMLFPSKLVYDQTEMFVTDFFSNQLQNFQFIIDSDDSDNVKKIESIYAKAQKKKPKS